MGRTKMKLNPRLKADIKKYLNYVIVVEGKKDVSSLKSLGFEKVYEIHKNHVSLKERIEQIASEIDKREKVCILTDFDKKGKTLYLLLKKEFLEIGVKLDSSLRGILIKSQLSHIEGLYSFIKKVDSIS
jgi:5S rRNA maturation endonuclease (ribonuclease M5)